jgi:hypothetical protein
MRLDVKIEDTAVQLALKAARRDLAQSVKQGLLHGAQRALPQVKVTAPTVVGQHLAAKATTRDAYITTVGPTVYDRIAGLLEWGGDVKTPLAPKKAQALKIGDTGEIRATVTGTRTYSAQQRIYRGISASLPVAEAVAREEVVKAFGGLGIG